MPTFAQSNDCDLIKKQHINCHSETEATSVSINTRRWMPESNWAKLSHQLHRCTEDPVTTIGSCLPFGPCFKGSDWLAAVTGIVLTVCLWVPQPWHMLPGQQSLPTHTQAQAHTDKHTFHKNTYQLEEILPISKTHTHNWATHPYTQAICTYTSQGVFIFAVGTSLLIHKHG